MDFFKDEIPVIYKRSIIERALDTADNSFLRSKIYLDFEENLEKLKKPEKLEKPRKKKKNKKTT